MSCLSAVRFETARARVGSARLQMHADDVKIVRAGHVELCPGKAAIGNLQIVPCAIGQEGEMADDPVRDVIARAASR